MASLEKEMATMKDDMAAIKNILSDHAEETASNGYSKMQLIKKDVERAAHKAGETAQTLYNEKREQLGDARVKYEDTVKNRPIAATAAAFAGGLLVAALLRRR